MKKVTISDVAGKSAAAGSRGKLKELLEVLGMQVMELQTSVSINSEAWTSDELTLSKEVKQKLHEQAEQFIDFI